MKKEWSIYKHTFPNGKLYIGCTSQKSTHRWGKDGNGYRGQPVWQAINDYGWNDIKHEIIATAYSAEDAWELERYYITNYRTNDPQFGYNIEAGGNNARGYKLSDETRQKMSESRKGDKNWIYGKHLSEETRKKLSIAHKGKKPNIEALIRAAENRKGANAYNARAVICYDLDCNVIGKYAAMAEGSRATGVSKQDIYSCCIGKQKTAHGTRWAYAEIE